MPSFRKECNLDYKRLCLIILKYDTKSIKSFKYLLGIIRQKKDIIMRSEFILIKEAIESHKRQYIGSALQPLLLLLSFPAILTGYTNQSIP